MAKAAAPASAYGMRLDTLSLQSAMHDTGRVGEVPQACERLIRGAMHGDRALFTSDKGTARLSQMSTRWQNAPPPVRCYPPVRKYPPGSWRPMSIHPLIAPHGWRPLFKRAWRNPNKQGG